MKKTVKVALIVLSGVIIVLLLNFFITSLFIGGVFSVPLNYKNAEKQFERKKEDMYIVSSYFSDLNYENIYIPNSMDIGIMSIDGNNVKIENDKVIQSIEKLKNNYCSVIGKENNTIYFQIWSNLDSGHGIAYTIDESEPKLQFLTKAEKLNEDNWYYYEEDYNKWKLRNN